MRKYLLFAVLSFCLWGGVKGQAAARMQVIHGSGDPTQDSIVGWVRDTFPSGGYANWFNAIAFREASSTIDIYAIDGVAFTDPGLVLADSFAEVRFPILDTTKVYAFLFSGVSNPAFFAANPSGKSTANRVYKIDNVREAGSVPGSVDILFFHGVTDAPTVDIRPQGSPIPLVNDISYGEHSAYFTIPVGNYTVEMTSADQSTVLKSFQLNLNGLSGQSFILMATGFMDPGANQNGEELNLCEVFSDGSVSCVAPLAVGIQEELATQFSVYPNPFNHSIQVKCSSLLKEDAQISVFNLAGQRVYGAGISSSFSAPISIDLATQPNGVYLLKVETISGSAAFSQLIHKN